MGIQVFIEGIETRADDQAPYVSRYEIVSGTLEEQAAIKAQVDSDMSGQGITDYTLRLHVHPTGAGCVTVEMEK